MNKIRIFPDTDSLYRYAVDLVAAAAEKTTAAGLETRFALLLSGGATPRRLYALLGAPDTSARIDWTRTHLFFGDERAVPVADPQNTFRMVSETLLSRVSVPESNIHRIPGELGAPEAALWYERELTDFFQGPPRFDLALLGMGADGHTASLFPGSSALDVTDRMVVASEGGDPPRITLTFPALNLSRRVVFLVTGAAKAPALAAALEGPPDPDLPARRVRPESGEIVWLADTAAAAFLRASPHEED